MAVKTVICIGMAGSGKTTFVQRLNSHMRTKNSPPYVINLDPAVLKVPYGANIDIRDSIKYKKVMENYNLGPNGAIVTSLNLFSTKIDQVIKLLENKRDKFEHCIVDTPGQIECFVWSASGAIITESFASTFPTVIAYIVDTPRNASPTTFMSNMLYACSILYKTKLPMILVFNKTDVCKADFAKEWMSDFEAFQRALRDDQELNGNSGLGSGYMSSLINSMSLMLEEFYSQLDMVGVSSFTGEGFDDFLEVVNNGKVQEYDQYYKAERDRVLKLKEEKEKQRKEKSLDGLMKDLGISDGGKKKGEADADVVSDVEEGENDGLVLPDEFEDTEREYTFSASDRTQGEINDQSAPDLQSAYQEAADRLRKDVSSETAENIAKYVRQ
ncbi:NPA3 (YJR072C) [Zygosaccharomyces parabailii]|uniref:GPN-loop GTPase n=1 Tax=Zygosaccharomyces bailii (strain CLIB 213 / ATCC 58445 / CBS 680 / BCRC 21525 / NBRC 1098 / NCYC 1416 / NRRL Y-2227) TaxID=1333698 RepID=A0A8J2T5X9_ZYGB2|nr:NPA3 (YJR072C) [Zygosaccharomyces parabailii]CDF88686.1 BN860_16050g1_1 [Zygosaccharomyces bailii CLIB 213]CDH13233.1 probable GTPase NPA3 [Zygosaccharomyces bailii ISA1307]SJM82537.1 probable GTPase NPA3 [Zygosaccharomyces bailii]